MYIMDYVDLNEVYALSNFDIFEDRSTAGRSIDWSRYIHKRLNSGLFPQDVDFQVFEEFEDVLFSKKLGSQMCFPMYQNEFFILCGLGVIFSEDFYQNIFSGDMSISTQNVQNYLLELMQIGLDPYQHDKEYQSLHHKYVPDVNMRKANSHLGLAKLNAFLQTIASLRVLSALQ